MFFGQGCYYDKEGIRNNVTGRGDGIMGKQNILDMQNGFNTRVNLYIIKYLYYNMKKAALKNLPFKAALTTFF